MNLNWLDWLMIAVPCTLVLAISVALRSSVRSVADFLAAGRGAGRYLICTATSELIAGATNMVGELEIFSQAGFSLRMWTSFEVLTFFLLALRGVVSYRFRETRSLTFHQFFEVRYSKGVRMLASFLNFVSGALSFAIQPAIGARFIIYFCDLPTQFMIGPVPVSTMGLLMTTLLGIALYMTLTGGQISVMLTDCVEGLVSGIFCLVIAICIMGALSYAQMEKVFTSGPHGQSLVNPFDISGHPEFNKSYVLMLLGIRLFIYRGNAWQAGFAAAAKSAHEGKMAGILTTWRQVTGAMLAALLSVGALTLLHHHDFSAQAAMVEHRIAALPAAERTEMRMPVALSLLLPNGARGALCAVLLFGMLAGLGGQMHAYGSLLVQDVLIPLRRRALSPRQQILWLRLSAVGMAIFAVAFGLLFKMPDYIIFVLQLLGAIYLCIGAVVWGGLYWKKGTTAGAWASLTVGAALAFAALFTTTFWQNGIAAELISIGQRLGFHHFAAYISQHQDKCPIRMQVLTTFSYGGAGIMYVLVSLLTSQKNFDLDKILHRGKYRVEVPQETPAKPKPKASPSRLMRLFGVTDDYSRGDKILAMSTTAWAIFWSGSYFIIFAWNMLVHRWSDETWFRWAYFKEIRLSLYVGFAVTIWFTIGGTRDIVDLFRTLRTAVRDDTDNGMILAERPVLASVGAEKTAAAIRQAQTVVLGEE